MTADEFLEWNQAREGHVGRWELIDGVPMQMMVGARRAHNVLTSNLVASLVPKMRPSECDVMSSDAAIRVSDFQVRYPDLLVDCGEGGPDDLAATEPVLVAEVASPSTRSFDVVRKLREYQSVPSIRYILLIEPSVIDVQAYARDGGDWTVTQYRALDDVIELSGLGTALPLADIYEGLNPDPGPPLQSSA